MKIAYLQYIVFKHFGVDFSIPLHSIVGFCVLWRALLEVPMVPSIDRFRCTFKPKQTNFLRVKRYIKFFLHFGYIFWRKIAFNSSFHKTEQESKKKHFKILKYLAAVLYLAQCKRIGAFLKYEYCSCFCLCCCFFLRFKISKRKIQY